MENTAINWAELLAPWMQILIPIVVGFFMALLTYLKVILRQRTEISVEQATCEHCRRRWRTPPAMRS